MTLLTGTLDQGECLPVIRLRVLEQRGREMFAYYIAYVPLRETLVDCSKYDNIPYPILRVILFVTIFAVNLTGWSCWWSFAASRADLLKRRARDGKP